MSAQALPGLPNTSAVSAFPTGSKRSATLDTGAGEVAGEGARQASAASSRRGKVALDRESIEDRVREEVCPVRGLGA